MVYGLFLSVSASILTGTWLGIHYDTFIRNLLQTQSDVMIPVIAILFGIQFLFLLYGPISCASELVICQYINSLTEVFETWKQIIENDPTLPTVHSNDIEIKHNNQQYLPTIHTNNMDMKLDVPSDKKEHNNQDR